MPKSLSTDWARVYVVGGEPCLAGFAVDAVVDKCGGHSRRYGKPEAEPMKAALTEFVMDEADVIVVTDPSAEMLRACFEIVDSGRLTATALVVVTPGGSLDGRTTFAAAANRAKRIYYYEPLEVNRIDLLQKHLADWENSCGVNFDSEAREWVMRNAPTILMSVKGKEVEVFDLLSLESEIDKASSVARVESVQISLELVKSTCQFERAGDIWGLVSGALGGKRSDVLAHLEKGVGGKGEGVLWLLLSQLAFFVCLKSLCKEGISNEQELCKHLSSAEYLGCYLSDHWEILESIPPPAPVSPWRVRKGLESSAEWALEGLSARYAAVTSAIRDLRAGLSAEIVLPYLTLALCGDVVYEEPLRPVTV